MNQHFWLTNFNAVLSSPQIPKSIKVRLIILVLEMKHANLLAFLPHCAFILCILYKEHAEKENLYVI